MKDKISPKDCLLALLTVLFIFSSLLLGRCVYVCSHKKIPPPSIETPSSLHQERIYLTIHYRKVTATAYTIGRESCGRWADGKTCYNRPAVPGQTIATDPRVLPHHKWYYLQGIGWRIAEDRGGAIKGNRVDVLVGTLKRAKMFGKKEIILTY